MPSNEFAYQILIIGVRKKCVKDIMGKLEEFNPHSFEWMYEENEIKELEDAYNINLSEHIDEYDIYKKETRSIEIQDMGNINESYFSKVIDEDDIDGMMDAWVDYTDDWLDNERKVVDYIKRNNENDVIILYFDKDVISV